MFVFLPVRPKPGRTLTAYTWIQHPGCEVVSLLHSTRGVYMHVRGNLDIHPPVHMTNISIRVCDHCILFPQALVMLVIIFFKAQPAAILKPGK